MNNSTGKRDGGSGGIDGSQAAGVETVMVEIVLVEIVIR